MLDVDNINTYYGDSHILHGVSLAVAEGELVSILGRNGVGKTTTLRSILGHTPPRNGTIRFNGDLLVGLNPYDVAKRGIGWVPEDRKVFPSLSVEENLRLAIRDDDVSIELAYEYFPTLADLADSDGRSLSGGEQQMLSIARGLLGNFEMLLIDEPTEGLAPMIIEDVVDTLKEVNEEVTILLVEQNVEAVKTVSDRVYFMTNGGIVAETDNLDQDEDLIDQHLKV